MSNICTGATRVAYLFLDFLLSKKTPPHVCRTRQISEKRFLSSLKITKGSCVRKNFFVSGIKQWKKSA